MGREERALLVLVFCKERESRKGGRGREIMVTTSKHLVWYFKIKKIKIIF